MRQAAGARLGRILWGAAVVRDEAVAHRSRREDRRYRVGEAGQRHVCDRIVAALAPAELRSFVEHHRIEDVTRPQVLNHVLNSFTFYRLHAFSDKRPW